VVGVARDVAPTRFGGSDNPAAYRLRRVDAQNNFMAVRFDTGASRGDPAIRAALRISDPDVFVIAHQLQAWIDQVTTIADLWVERSRVRRVGVEVGDRFLQPGLNLVR
jgi:hypothetical protein